MLNAWEFTASHPLPKNPHCFLPARISNATHAAHVLKHLRPVLGEFLLLKLLERGCIPRGQRARKTLADPTFDTALNCSLNGLNTLDSVLASFG
jgi:hypothetical protein